MNRNGAIIIVEDDPDDRELIKDIFDQLAYQNKIVFLNDGIEAFEFLIAESAEPFIIISDINMPRMNGIELRDKLQQEGGPRLKAIPYLFLTTGSSVSIMRSVYTQSVQGYFVKHTNFNSFKLTMKHIVDYWSDCALPA
jgi:CheY-like chemotaxis protein